MINRVNRKRLNSNLLKLLMMILIVFFSVLIKNTAYAVATGYLGTVGREVSSLTKITINKSKMKVSSNLVPSGNPTKWVKANGSYYTGNGSMHYLKNGTTYTITYDEAFTWNGNKMSVTITIKPTQSSANSSSYISLGIASDNDIDLYNYKAKADVTYTIKKGLASNGTTVYDYFCYGYEDPDGGDYLFTSGNNTNYDIYYKVPGTSSQVNTFKNGFKIDSGGIKRQAYTYDFNNPVILIAHSGVTASSLKINWSTTEGGGGDWMDLPRIYYAPGIVVNMNMNGGSLQSSHGSTISNSGNWVLLNNSKVIHFVKSTDSGVGSNGFADYNNSSYINIARTGYHINSGSEYNTKADGTGTNLNQTTNYSYSILSSYKATDNTVTLYLNWKANTYTINYTLNGGTHGSSHPTTGTYDANVNISNPTREGYTFDGWTMTNGNTSTATYGTSSSAVTTAWNPATTKVKATYFKNLTATNGAAVTLTANWTEKTATLTYDANGHGTAPSAVTMKYTTATNAASAITATGYTFTGWNTKNDGTGTSYAPGALVNGTNIVPTDMTLYAMWVSNSSLPILRVDPNGGTVSVTSPTGGTAQTISSAREYQQNYNTTLTLGTPSKAPTEIETNFTVSYGGNGGIVGTINNSNTSATKTDTTTYTFTSWTRSSSFYGSLSTNNLTYTFPAINNVTSIITANYSGNTTSVTTAVTLPSATKIGYTLAGWYTEETGGTRVGGSGGTYTPSGNVTLYAHWTPINYTITYNLCGGTNNGNNPSAYNVEDNDIEILDATYTLYYFDGWQKAVTNMGWEKGYINNEGVVNINQEAYHSGKQVLGSGITYTLSGYGNINTEDISWIIYDDNDLFLSCVSGATYTPEFDCIGVIVFNGNSTESQRNATTITGGGVEAGIEIPSGSTGNITLTANWAVNPSVVEINPLGGTCTVMDLTGVVVPDYTETISNMTPYPGNTGNTLFFNDPEKANTTEDTIYTISYDGNDGTVGTTTEANTESIRTDTTEWTFVGWTYDSLNGMVEDVTFNNEPVHKYTYGPGAGAEDTITAEYTTDTTNGTASLITLPNATRIGYTLKGWYTAQSGGTKRGNAGETYRPSTSETLYAQWTANTATITIKKNNANWSGSGINVALYQSGTSQYAYSTATVENETVSWSTVTAGTYDVYASKSAGALTTLVDTGIDVVVSNTGTATIDYYTLTLNQGVGISAVSGAGIFLSGQSANIDATVMNGYTWEGWSVISGNNPE